MSDKVQQNEKEKEDWRVPAPEVYGDGSVLPPTGGIIPESVEEKIKEEAKDKPAAEPEPVKKKTYPYPTQQGYTYENEEDEQLGIETARYDNGGVTKRKTLSDGRVATCRRLKGKDTIAIQRLIGGNAEKYQAAVTAQCTKIDEQELQIEDLEEMWMDDATAINLMASINFPSSLNK
jgi:hypothetical protein